MAFLNSLSQLRVSGEGSLDWGKTYLWDIRIDGIPSPFNSFFPAISVDEERATLNTYSFDFYLTSFKVPKGTSVRSIKIEFADNEKNTLFNFFDTWINTTILNNGNYVATLETAVKSLHLLKLDSTRAAVETFSYWVFPEGTLTYVGNSESGLRTYSMNFVIAGIKTGDRFL